MSLIYRFLFVGFQKIYLFWVVGIILEAWDVELEQVRPFVTMPSEKGT